MKFLKRLFFATAVALVTGSQANAGLILDITNVTLTPGSGIGIDANEGTGTLLGLSATADSPPPMAELNNPGDFYTFSAAHIQFAPPETNIRAAETDNVGMTLTLTFADPSIGSVDLLLNGTATPGPVGDPSPDYSLVFSAPVHILTSNGGEFELSITSIALVSVANDNQCLMVTVTLNQAPHVPEPSSMALLGLGGIGMAFARYRKRCTADV
jgi:hypothetical protein